MQIVSNGDNLHEMSKPVFWEKYFSTLSAENFIQHAKLLNSRPSPCSIVCKKKNADLTIHANCLHWTPVFREKYFSTLSAEKLIQHANLLNRDRVHVALWVKKCCYQDFCSSLVVQWTVRYTCLYFQVPQLPDVVELEERQLECRKNCAFNFPVSRTLLISLKIFYLHKFI